MHVKLIFLVIFYFISSSLANDIDGLKNITENSTFNNEDEVEEVFGELLERWTLQNRNTPMRGREARIIPIESNIQMVAAPQFTNNPINYQQNQKYIPIQTSGNNVHMSKRMENIEISEHRHSNEHIISRIQQQTNTPPLRQSFNSPREVSETDLYLLGAIEKLAYRVDYLEKRLKRTEQIVYYLMSGNNQNEKPVKVEEDPCGKNFKQIGDVCYHMSVSDKVDWKTASTKCKSMGAILAEFDKIENYKDVVAYVLNNKTLRGEDFWIGGLNPGLLWIWSTSARPINPNTNLTSFNNKNEVVNKIPVKVLNQNKTQQTNSTTITTNFPEIIGDGRCLRISYNPSKFGYGYVGADCIAKQHFMCMIIDKTLDNEIKRLAKELKFKS